jgi:hypothetical protein
MAVEDRLTYETRVGKRQAVIAGLAGVLLVAAISIQLGGPHAKVNEQTLGLITADKRFARDLIGSLLDAIGSFGLAWTLLYLFRAAQARNPEIRPPFQGIIAVAGGVISGVAVVAYIIAYGIQAHQFVTNGSQTWGQADKVLGSPAILIPQLLDYLGALLLAVGIVLVSLNAMRVGLLTRFMGYLGIFSGVFVIFPLVPIPIVQGFWLLAIAYLFTGRWPTGVPPAWQTGRAEPWPSSAQLREQRMKATGGDARRKPGPKPAPKPAAEPVGAGAARTRATTPKRKRKRRR